MYTFWFVNMPNATAGYVRFSYSIVSFGNFSYITTCLKRHNFIKLLQTMCQGRSVEIYDYVSLVFWFIFLLTEWPWSQIKNEYFPKVLIFDYWYEHTNLPIYRF